MLGTVPSLYLHPVLESSFPRVMGEPACQVKRLAQGHTAVELGTQPEPAKAPHRTSHRSLLSRVVSRAGALPLSGDH